MHRTPRRKSLLLGATLLAVALPTGCGESDKRASTTSDAAPASGEQYRNRLAPIQQRADEARSRFHDARGKPQVKRRARALSAAWSKAAREMSALRPPTQLRNTHEGMVQNFRQGAAAIGRETRRSRLSTSRLGDAVRKHEQAGGALYDEVLTSP